MRPSSLLVLAAVLASAPAARAQHVATEPAAPRAAPAGAHSEDTLDPVHHSADGYYLDFEPVGKVELPRLFLVRSADGAFGFDAFSSTAAALRSGRYVAEAEHGAAAKAPADETLENTVAASLTTPGSGGTEEHTGANGRSADELIASGEHLDATLVPIAGSPVIDLSITRHLVFALIAAIIVLVLALRMAARYRHGVGRTSAPKGMLQNGFEALFVFVRDDIARPNIGAKADKFLPYLLTAFSFILVANLIGLLPWGATATSNIAVTAVLALFTFLATQVFASKDHWKHVFWPPGMPFLMKLILIPVEIMGLFIKPFALAIRLFANMTAGHLVILSFIGLIFTFAQLFGPVAGFLVSPVSVLFALFVYVLELLVAFLQAYVFTMLSAIFIGMSVAEHAHHDHTPEAHTRSQPHAAGEVYKRDGDMALTA